MSEAIKTLRQDPAPSHLGIQHVVTSGLKSPRLLFFPSTCAPHEHTQTSKHTKTSTHTGTTLPFLSQFCNWLCSCTLTSILREPSPLDLYLQHKHCICMPHVHVLCMCLPLFFPSFPLGKSPLLSSQQEGSVRVFLPTVWGSGPGFTRLI